MMMNESLPKELCTTHGAFPASRLHVSRRKGGGRLRKLLQHGRVVYGEAVMWTCMLDRIRETCILVIRQHFSLRRDAPSRQTLLLVAYSQIPQRCASNFHKSKCKHNQAPVCRSVFFDRIDETSLRKLFNNFASSWAF